MGTAPKPLTEPYVNLSIHTALIIQPLPVIPTNEQIAEGVATSKHLPYGQPVLVP